MRIEMKASHLLFASALALAGCGSVSQDLGNDDPHDGAAPEAGPSQGAGTDAGGGATTDGARGTSPTDLGPAILFGGFLEADTWSWDGAAWLKLDTNSQMTSPQARMYSAMAPLDGKLVLFGGTDPGLGTNNDTWIWDGTTWTDTHADSSGSTPAPRDSAVMAPLGGRLVLFGGEDTGALYGDTWSWDGAAWSLLQVAGPPATSDAVMAPLEGKLVLFMGTTSDTWTFDGAAWSKVATTGPSPRSGAAMAPLNGKLFLFGGTLKANDNAETWMWDGTQWTQLAIAGPSARYGFAMTAFAGKIVLFSGTRSVNGTDTLDDTWTFDGSTWTQVNAAYHPPIDFGSAMSVRQ